MNQSLLGILGIGLLTIVLLTACHSHRNVAATSSHPVPAAEDGQTPLMLAARAGDAKTIRNLLASGALINARTDRGVTALGQAARSGDSETIQCLLDAGADIEQLTTRS